MNKREIEQAGLYGGVQLHWRDVARASRHFHMTLRHVWPLATDARIWDAVRRAYLTGAQELANRFGREIDVYSAHGDLITQVGPDVQS